MNADTDYDAEMILRDFIESLAKEVEGEEEINECSTKHKIKKCKVIIKI